VTNAFSGSAAALCVGPAEAVAEVLKTPPPTFADTDAVSSDRRGIWPSSTVPSPQLQPTP
jgi:hypothetical protein